MSSVTGPFVSAAVPGVARRAARTTADTEHANEAVRFFIIHLSLGIVPNQNSDFGRMTLGPKLTQVEA
jgi:hypothetical protein